MHVTKLCDVDFPSRYHNYIKISDLLTAVSLKNEICYAYWLREKLTPCMPCRNRMELPFQLCQRISCWNFTRTLKNILAYLQGWFGNPPTTRRRLPVDLFPTRVENPSHEEGIVRGLTFADLPRDAYLTMRVVHTQIAADCRGVCAGVTQFVVTNEHNMIISYGQVAIYSRTFSALLAQVRHRHPPPSCVVSFVHVCQYVTDRYTDPSPLARIFAEAKTARDRGLYVCDHKIWDLSVLLHFLPIAWQIWSVLCIYTAILMLYENDAYTTFTMPPHIVRRDESEKYFFVLQIYFLGDR